jgi:hypothetical protein
MEADLYDATKDGLSKFLGAPASPSRLGIVVTKSDTLDVTNPSGDNAPTYAKSLWIGGAGNLNVVLAGDQSNAGAGTAVLFTGVPVGLFPVQVRRVMATLTTATLIVGMY